MFTVRHVSGTDPDHMAASCFFGTRPEEGKNRWMRWVPSIPAATRLRLGLPPGHNNDGKGEFPFHHAIQFDPHEWSRVEISWMLPGNGAHGRRQPPGNKAVKWVVS